jgi:hypothetical protein
MNRWRLPVPAAAAAAITTEARRLYIEETRSIDTCYSFFIENVDNIKYVHDITVFGESSPSPVQAQLTTVE